MQVLVRLMVLILGAVCVEAARAQDMEVDEFAFAVSRTAGWMVLLTEEDIEKYELRGHTIHLTNEAIVRLGENPRWQEIDNRPGGRFRVEVRGEAIYEGMLHHPASSMMPSGPCVELPLLRYLVRLDQPDKTYFSIHFHDEFLDPRRGVRDPRADSRVVVALCRAGILAE